MRRIRNFFGSLDLSVFKIAGAALAAITVALLSSYLTGYVSSLILAGMASVVTAIASEFYRAVLSVTSRNAVAAAKRTVSSSSLLSTGSTQDGDTEEIPVVSDKATDSDSSVSVESRVSNFEGIEIDKSTLLGKIVSVLPEWLTSADPRKVKRILRHTSMFMATMFITIGATCLIVSAIKGEPVYKTIVTTNSADVDALKERIANLEAEHQKNGGSFSSTEAPSTEKPASSQPSTASSASRQSSHDSANSEEQSDLEQDNSNQTNQNSGSKSDGSSGYKSNPGSGNKTQAGGSSQHKQSGQQNSQQSQPDSEQNKAGVSQESSEQNQNTENGGGNKPESGQDVNSQNDKAAPDSEILASENKQP